MAHPATQTRTPLSDALSCRSCRIGRIACFASTLNAPGSRKNMVTEISRSLNSSLVSSGVAWRCSA